MTDLFYDLLPSPSQLLAKSIDTPSFFPLPLGALKVLCRFRHIQNDKARLQTNKQTNAELRSMFYQPLLIETLLLWPG